MKKIIYKGIIELKPYGENDEALYIGDMDDPLAEDFENNLKRKNISVRYFISKQDKTKSN
jgi:hypothetical protein